MAQKRVDGLLLEKMLNNGAANLYASMERINALNVFPVADGDTGTNMYLTLENGLRRAQSCREIGPYLRSLSEGMLLGARGNSGVILSQLFRGIAQELSRCSAAGPGEWRNAWIRGYRTAYNSVVCPVEGTILTVAREGIEHIRSQISRSTTMEELFSMYLAEMRRSQAGTPELLAVLKEADVVDSGAEGYITIVEGMLKYLYGEVLGAPQREAAARPEEAPDLSLFNEKSSFEDGYCMEFLLQRMTGESYNPRFRLSSYISELKLYGNSLVVTQDGFRVKVHIHTFCPAKVIALSQAYGEFLSFKLENMQLQHNEQKKKQSKAKRPHKPVAVVAVVNGAGVEKTFLELGCDCVIDGGATMNTPSQEFIDAFRQLDADRIVVLPNHANIIRSAQQAITLYKADNAVLIPTKSIPEGYCALAMDIADEPDASQRIRQMQEGAEGVTTLTVAKASRDYTEEGHSCRAGQSIAMINGELAAAADDPVEALLAAMAEVPEMADMETCLLFRGAEASEDEAALLEARLAEQYPCLELNFMEGDQPIYRWQIGLF